VREGVSGEHVKLTLILKSYSVSAVRVLCQCLILNRSVYLSFILFLFPILLATLYPVLLLSLIFCFSCQSSPPLPLIFSSSSTLSSSTSPSVILLYLQSHSPPLLSPLFSSSFTLSLSLVFLSNLLFFHSHSPPAFTLLFHAPL
jgi:hypothetical protein